LPGGGDRRVLEKLKSALSLKQFEFIGSNATRFTGDGIHGIDEGRVATAAGVDLASQTCDLGAKRAGSRVVVHESSPMVAGSPPPYAQS